MRLQFWGTDFRAKRFASSSQKVDWAVTFQLFKSHWLQRNLSAQCNCTSYKNLFKYMKIKHYNWDFEKHTISLQQRFYHSNQSCRVSFNPRRSCHSQCLKGLFSGVLQFDFFPHPWREKNNNLIPNMMQLTFQSCSETKERAFFFNWSQQYSD